MTTASAEEPRESPPLTSDASEGLPVTVRRPGWWVLLLIAYGLCLNLPYLGSTPLMSHEILVAQRTQGLVSEGGWLVPYREGRPDFNKPVLPFWVAGAISVVAGEVNEWILRLPSVAATIGTMLLLVFYVRRKVSWRAALVTGWVFLTSSAAFQYGRRAEVDMVLAFLTTLSLLAYLRGIEEPERRRQIGWFLLMWIAAGFGVLAKGPLPVGVLLVTMLVMAVMCPEARRLGRMLPLSGPLVMLAVVAAWAVPVILTNTDAVTTWNDQSLGRMAGELGHEKPWYYYIVRAPTLWLPWILPVAVGAYLAVRRGVLDRRHTVFHLAWGVAGLVLLSVSTGKRVHYALPVTPPFLILAGLGLDYILFVVPRRLSQWTAALFWLHTLAVPGSVAGIVAGVILLPQHAAAIVVVGTILAITLAWALMLYYRYRRAAAVVVLALGLGLASVLGIGLIVTPVSQAVGYDATIGRALAARGDTPACAFVPSGADLSGNDVGTVTFYAGHALTVVQGPDDLERWRTSHPGGLVLVRQEDIALVKMLGAWTEALPPGDPRWSEGHFVLLGVPEIPAAPSPDSTGTTSTTNREEQHGQ